MDDHLGPSTKCRLCVASSYQQETEETITVIVSDDLEITMRDIGVRFESLSRMALFG